MSNVTQYELTSQYYYDLKLRYAVNFCINTVTTIIASVLIIWKSTPKMKTYRWLLLDLTVVLINHKNLKFCVSYMGTMEGGGRVGLRACVL